MIAPHELQALKNHSQSLERLASRGCLSATECVAVLESRADLELGSLKSRRTRSSRRWSAPGSEGICTMKVSVLGIMLGLLAG